MLLHVAKRFFNHSFVKFSPIRRFFLETCTWKPAWYIRQDGEKVHKEGSRNRGFTTPIDDMLYGTNKSEYASREKRGGRIDLFYNRWRLWTTKQNLAILKRLKRVRARNFKNPQTAYPREQISGKTQVLRTMQP